MKSLFSGLVLVLALFSVLFASGVKFPAPRLCPPELSGAKSSMVTLPYSTSFETAAERADWTVYTLGSSAVSWSVADDNAATGEYSFVHWWNDAHLDGWLVSPPLELPDGADPYLTFQQYTLWTFDYRYHGVAISSGSPDPEDGDFVELAEIDFFSDEEWSEVGPIDITGYSGTVYLAFHYEGTDGDVWYVDDVFVGVPLEHDVACEGLSIENPFVEPDIPLTISATLDNSGLSTESFYAIIDVQENGVPFFTDSVEVSSLAPGGSRDVTFSSFTPSAGNIYQVYVFPRLETDEYTGNDTTSIQLYTYTNPMKPLLQAFESVACPYCSRAAEGLRMLEAEYDTSIIIAVYHSTLSIGSDPFYSREFEDVADYYGVSGFPTVWTNGSIEVSGGYPSSESYGLHYYEDAVEQILSYRSPFIVDITVDTIDILSARISVDVEVTGEIPDDMDAYLRLALVEDSISYHWAPGSPAHNYVLHCVRSLVTPTSSGVHLPVYRGYEESFDFDITLSGSWDPSRLFVLAYIQDHPSRFIWQAKQVKLEPSTGMDEKRSPSVVSVNFFPNPFNACGRISVNSPEPGEICIYNIKGEAVDRFSVENGETNILWNASGLPTGLYLYRFEGESSSVSGRVILLK